MIMQCDDNEIAWQKVKCYFMILVFQNQCPYHITIVTLENISNGELFPTHVIIATLEISLMENYKV